MKFVIALVFCFATCLCSDVLNAPTPAPTDLRNEFDHLLIQMTQDKTRQLEEALLRLTRQLAELHVSKDKALQTKIIAEIETGLPLLRNAEAMLERELKRTDLDLLERYIFESSRDDVQILLKQMTALETQVKAMNV